MVFKVRQVRQIARSFEEGTLVFHFKKWTNLSKNRCKNDAKSCSKQQGHKTRWKMRLHINILSANCDFWSILRPPGLPKRNPKWTLGVKISTQLGSGGAQGAPRANFSRCLVNFGVLLGPGWSFWDPTGTLFGAYGSIQQQIAAKMAILVPYSAVFCSKKQQTSANSYE